MLSRRECGELLAGADDIAALAAITRAVGFTGIPEPIDRRTRRALGIADDCRKAWVQKRAPSGGGILRALLLDASGAAVLRDRLTRIGRRLVTHQSPLLWLIGAIARDQGRVALAVVDSAGARPRVRALVVDLAKVTESDADTLAALAAAAGGDDVAAHTRWIEVLGREAVTRRFYQAVARHVDALALSATGHAHPEVRREQSLLQVSRLLFLAFLESKGWLDGNRAFLAERFADCMLRGGGFHQRVLQPLFFGTLNTPMSRRAPLARALGRIPFLNGGLFARASVEKLSKLRFPDDSLGEFLDDVLTRYRFTSREESDEWSEAAIDPEMLGKSFESLMEEPLRRSSGSYYTPQQLVAHVTDSALYHALGDAAHATAGVEGLLKGEVPADERGRSRLKARLGALRVLDPACGSGAFLVYALERLADLQSALGDRRPREMLRRHVLATSIFGVDVNPTAVWLCELRLWLSCVIDSSEDVVAVQPLPNLDRNIRVGDSLIGDGFEPGVVPLSRTTPLTKLRMRYIRATGRRKLTLARALDREVKQHVTAILRAQLHALTERRHALLHAARGRDLFGRRRGALPAELQQLADDRAHARELRMRLESIESSSTLPFSFSTHFADVLDRGGFDVVLGNPPWVRPHHLGPAMREALRSRYAVLRHATWRHGAELAGVRSAFGGQGDLSAAFVERALALLTDGGTVALLVPMKLWKSIAGGGIRRHLFERAQLKAVEDWSDAAAVFDAVVYPSLVVAQRCAETARDVAVTVHRRDLAIRWRTPQESVAFDDSTGSPWMLLPPDARASFNRLRAIGVALHACGLGRVTLGVKTGCNAAFVVRRGSDDVESSLLRPLLRGGDVTTWVSAPSGHCIVWTHGRNGRPLDRLPPLAHMHFMRYRSTLQQRSDARGTKWWSLFRTDGARSDLPRVVWSDVARVPRASVLRAGDPTVPLNTCYVVRCRDEVDAVTLAALLNSPIAAAWLGALAEPARGGYRRLFAWTVASFPVPDDWSRARDILGALGCRAVEGFAVSAAELFDAACQAYRLRASSVAALCDWMLGAR